MTGTAADIAPEDLHRLALFKSVPYHEIQEIMSSFPLQDVATGTVVIAAKEPGQRMYLVIKGTLTVHLDSPDDEPIAEMSRGDMFGELSVIDGEISSAFVVANSDCQLISLDRPALWDLYQRSPYIAHNLLNTLARRIRNSNNLIEHLQRELQEPESGFDIEPEL